MPALLATAEFGCGHRILAGFDPVEFEGMRARGRLLVMVIAATLLGALITVSNPFGWTTNLRDQIIGLNQTVPAEAKAETITFDPLSAPVPSLCGHAAGRLTNGELLGADAGGTYARKNGLGEIVSAVDERPDDAEAVAVLALSCNKGGVGWPDTVAVYDRASKLLGHVILDSITGGSRELVGSVEISNGSAHASWTAAGEGDPDCCGTVTASTSFELVDSVLTPGEINLASEETALKAFLDALNRGDDATAETYVNDRDVVAKFSALRTAEGSLHPVKCYGLLNSKQIPAHLLDSLSLDASGNISLPSSSGIRRFCTVANDAARKFIFGWGYDDAGGWLIRFIST